MCGKRSIWRPVTSGCTPGVSTGSSPSIFINDVNDGAECSLNNCADNTKLGGMGDTPECGAAIHRNLNRLEKFRISDHEFQQREVKVLHLGRSNPRHH